MDTKSRLYELKSLLYEIDDKGVVVIFLPKLLRLLDKGNRAAGTWKAFLDAWEDRWRGEKPIRATCIRSSSAARRYK